MTTNASPTRRDTFAFVLTIFGATFWAVFPASLFFREDGVWENVGLPVTFAAGAFLGAWAGTTVWRHVSRVVPAIAAAFTAGSFMAARACASGVGLELVCIAAAIAGSAVGTELGWRARAPQRAVVAAWITLGAPMLLGTIFMFFYRLGYVDDDTAKWIVIFSFIPGSVLTARLCRGVRPDRFAIWLFGLLFSIFLVMMASDSENTGTEDRDNDPGMGGKIVGSLILCGVVTGICSIPVRVAFRRHPETADLPTAQLR